MSKIIVTCKNLFVNVKVGKAVKKGLYRYKDLAATAKEKALQEVTESHIFDLDYVLETQAGNNSWASKKEYCKFLLELEDDNYWYKKNGKIAMRTNPLILEADELSVDNLEDDEENYAAVSIQHENAESYARVYGFKSWESLEKDFNKQVKLLDINSKVQVKRKKNGFELKVGRNFTYKYWKKHA